jgi:polyhydroxyalkanoate synthesis regulator phasin
MPDFERGLENIVKQAFYLGVGIASSAPERVRDTLIKVKSQAQQLADEMIARGEMNVEEARKFVDDIVRQAQQDVVQPTQEETTSKEPRVIEIISEEEPETKKPDKVEDLKQQVASLQEELRRLQRE